MTVLLDVRDLVKHYDTAGALLPRLLGRAAPRVQALNGVSLSIRKGETLGLIGESGCGKSTLGRTILRLHEPDAGRIAFAGTDITRLKAAALKPLRARMQIIFQNPYASLNPQKTVAQILAAPLLLHTSARGAALRARVVAMLEAVGLTADHAGRHPHQFSGGQRQRIAIARALIVNPEFVVCDEPVSALDVSIQAQIIALLARLKRDLGLTYLFISHDIAVIGYVSDHVAVMYLGQIVEAGPARAVLAAPQHPYTRALMSAVPRLDRGGEARVRLTGDLPSPLHPPPGCRFHPRCPVATAICLTSPPPARAHTQAHHVVCHHVPEHAP
jgi:oligopeptide/dipeptide ABC transporter ATP-binding protein